MIGSHKLEIKMTVNMKLNKASELVLRFLSDGEKPRHMVTSKIKNFDGNEQRKGILALIAGEYISQREEIKDGRGRNPVFISLTEKGIKRAKDIQAKPQDKSIWSI